MPILNTWLQGVAETSTYFTQLCEPLLKRLRPSFVRLTLISKENDITVFTTRPDILDCFFTTEVKKFGRHEGKIDDYQNGFVLYDNLAHTNEKVEQFIKPFSEGFNCGSGIAIYIKNPDSLCIFEMNLTPQIDNPNLLIMQHYQWLERFILYHLLQSNAIHNSQANTMLNPFQSSQYLECVNNEIILKDDGISKVSKRELACALWYANGKLIPEIAQILALSPRTVETYVANLKKKLKAYTPFQLGMMIGKYQRHFVSLFKEL